MKYIVTMKEVHSQEIVVDAASPAEAKIEATFALGDLTLIDLARDGDGDYANGSSYEYLLDKDAWEVREA